MVMTSGTGNLEGGFDDIENERPAGKFIDALAVLVAHPQVTPTKGNYPFVEGHTEEASSGEGSNQEREYKWTPKPSQ